MDLNEAKILATSEIIKHKLHKYTFKWINTKSIYGRCSYKNFEIQLSKPFVEINDEPAVRLVLMHEIAHALTKGCGHTGRFKKVSRELGGSPGCHLESGAYIKVPGNYKCQCINCNKIVTYIRNTGKQYACAQCCKAYNNGNYSDKYLLKEMKE